MDPSVVVIGAGIIGVTTALELCDRGWSVTLIDRQPPGSETSFGSAGVLSGSTVLTTNNRGIWRQMHRLLINRSNYFRYDPAFACRHWRWLAAFLRFSFRRDLLTVARLLTRLQQRSVKKHLILMERAQALALCNEMAWIKLYRTEQHFKASRLERNLMDAVGVSYRVLPGAAVAEIEPALNTDFHCAVIISDSISVRDPAGLTDAYLSLFEQAGGTFLHGNVRKLHRENHGSWEVHIDDSETIHASDVVIAAGPWAADVCGILGYSIPLAWERGYHTHVDPPEPPLQRSVFDVAAGVVMTPQTRGVRITSGVEFTARDAPPDFRMIRQAVAAARRVAEFGPEIDTLPWLGSRPTLPDSLPMVGRAPRHQGLWFNFGHQHIGLSISTGSAELLANLLARERQADGEAAAFAPQRFSI